MDYSKPSRAMEQENYHSQNSAKLLCLTLASSASVAGAICAPAQGVTDAIVRFKRLIDWQTSFSMTTTGKNLFLDNVPLIKCNHVVFGSPAVRYIKCNFLQFIITRSKFTSICQNENFRSSNGNTFVAVNECVICA